MTNPNPPQATEPLWSSDRIDERVAALEYEYVDSGAFIVDASDVYLLCREIQYDMQQEIDRLTAENEALARASPLLVFLGGIRIGVVLSREDL
jgi:hypothetical protein